MPSVTKVLMVTITVPSAERNQPVLPVTVAKVAVQVWVRPAVHQSVEVALLITITVRRLEITTVATVRLAIVLMSVIGPEITIMVVPEWATVRLRRRTTMLAIGLGRLLVPA